MRCTENAHVSGSWQLCLIVIIKIDASYTFIIRCAPCVRWTVKLSGSSYSHESWKAIPTDGNTESKFEVASVKTGSKWDPVKNCQQWHLESQLILRVRGREAPIKGLSCGNQLIQIEGISKEEGICDSR